MQNNEIQDYNESLPLELQKLQPKKLTEFSPNNPPWNSLIGIAMWIASVFFIAVIPIIGIGIYLAANQTNFSDPGKLQTELINDPNAILVNIICVIPAHILTIILAWLIVTWGRKYSFKEMLGWEWGGFNLIYLIGIVFGFFVLSALISLVLPETENDLLRILKSSRIVVFFVAFMATFTAPLVEEVVYRGIMYSAFQRTFGVSLAVSLVTLLFALVHVPQYYPSVSTIIMIVFLSLTLTLIRVRSGNLFPCIVLHTIFNGIQSAFLIAQPYLEQYAKTPQTQNFFFWLN